MPELITLEIFNHLVHLAALELDPEEAEYLRHQLNNQLKAIQELEAIPLEAETPIASHGVPYPPHIRPPIRQDEWQSYPAPQDILGQVPHVEDGYIVVPDIPHVDLR